MRRQLDGHDVAREVFAAAASIHSWFVPPTERTAFAVDLADHQRPCAPSRSPAATTCGSRLRTPASPCSRRPSAAARSMMVAMGTPVTSALMTAAPPAVLPAAGAAHDGGLLVFGRQLAERGRVGVLHVARHGNGPVFRRRDGHFARCLAQRVGRLLEHLGYARIGRERRLVVRELSLHPRHGKPSTRPSAKTPPLGSRLRPEHRHPALPAGTAKAMPGASSVTPAAVPMTLVTVGFMASPSLFHVEEQLGRIGAHAAVGRNGPHLDQVRPRRLGRERVFPVHPPQRIGFAQLERRPGPCPCPAISPRQ